MPTLEQIKAALGITGDYQDATLQQYYAEVVAFLLDAGVNSHDITVGIVARGISDLWNYGGAEGKLSEYFLQRAAQLKNK